jgi:hypothetical protein
LSKISAEGKISRLYSHQALPIVHLGVLVFSTIEGTTMKPCTMFLAAAIVALSPAMANASPEKDALNACAAAFATSLAAPGAAAPAFKVVDGGARGATSVGDFFARDYTFYLYANSQKTGLPIARASCSTDARGAVISLLPVPLDAAPRTLAYRQ